MRGKVHVLDVSFRVEVWSKRRDEAEFWCSVKNSSLNEGHYSSDSIVLSIAG